MSDNKEQKPLNEMYHIWNENDPESKKQAFANSGETIKHFKAFSANRNTHDVLPNISTRTTFTEDDYYYWRPEERVERAHFKIVKQSTEIYESNGIIKNIVDLMGDFGCQGIRLAHPDKKKQKIFRKWFKLVNGKDRSERILNNLYRTGNVIIDVTYGRLPPKDYRKFRRAQSDTIKNLEPKVKKRVIPYQYTILNPCTVYVVGGELSCLTDNKQFALVVPKKAKELVLKKDKTPEEQLIVDGMNQEMVAAILEGRPYILNPKNTRVLHYKKDDWDDWAKPMIYSVIDDITLLDKMKLTDRAALDGSVSKLRIIKLGNTKEKIQPAPAAASTLAGILEANVGGGTLDIIWDDNISIEESNSNAHEILGEAKYKPVYNAIYSGLGIPPTLTGTSDANGTTNNFISLKTLIERLMYGREVLTSFWDKEIAHFTKVMGLGTPAIVEYDMMYLADEAAMKTLCLNMVDRNLMSEEAMQNIMNLNSEIEDERLYREEDERIEGKRTKRGGPFFDGDVKNSLKKISLQTKMASPQQIGVELLDGPPPQEDSKETKQSTELKGQPGQGRPRNSRDSSPRKPRTFISSVGLDIWMSEAQRTIDEVVREMALKEYGKTKLVQLTKAEVSQMEDVKLGAFFNLEPMSKVTEEYISLSMSEKLDPDIYDKYKQQIEEVSLMLGRPPTLEQQKMIQASIYKELIGV